MKRTLATLALLGIAIAGLAGWLVLIKMPSYETTNWTTVEGASYTVKIPDGWIVYQADNSGAFADADCAYCLNYKAGTKAKVMRGESLQFTKETRTQFFFNPAANEPEATYFEGYEKTGSISAKNISGTTYYKKIAASESGIGFEVYGYAFTKNAHTIFITHTVGTGGTDRHKLVEKLIGTLELK